MPNRLLRGLCITATTAAAAAALVTTSAGSASATPPAPHLDRSGQIVVDVPAGEWWSCEAVSTSPPFLTFAPALDQFALGPTQLHFPPFPHGAHVWVNCNGNALPVVYYGPVLTVR